jgi:hypothetical protein
MDQLDPFPKDFCLLPYNQPMSVCRSACADIKWIGQTLVCPIHAGRKSHIYLVLSSEAGFKGYLQSA